MQRTITGDSKRQVRIVANVGAVVTALWLLAYLVPPCRSILLDTALSYVLGLMAVGLLAWAAYRSMPPPRFWALLAAAWTVNLLANIGWGMYEQITGQALPYISLVALATLVRYILVFAAFWQGFRLPSGRQWFWLLGILALSAALVIGAYYYSVPVWNQSLASLAGALFPILDIGLLYLALEAWTGKPSGGLRNALALLALALFFYGAASWLSFFGRAMSVGAVAGLASLFWPLSDILAGVAVLHLVWASAPAEVSLEQWEP